MDVPVRWNPELVVVSHVNPDLIVKSDASFGSVGILVPKNGLLEDIDHLVTLEVNEHHNLAV